MKKKYGCSEILVESEVRRSTRIKSNHKGYNHSNCQNKQCFGCTAEPPTLSPSIIKNLGTDFCNLSPEKVKDEALKKKRKVKAPVGQKEKPDEEASKPDEKKGKKPKVSTKKIKKKPSKDDKHEWVTAAKR
ncbi:hypothetical protein EJB05_53305, partial [Eragrostis curvula]